MARRRWGFGCLVGLVLALFVGTSSPAEDDWPTYHHSADRAGNAAAVSSFTDVQASWNSGPLDGAVYAEPLYVGGRVLVATENNTVYAFDAASGSGLWQTHLADPVQAGGRAGGDIGPIGRVTGTPTDSLGTRGLYAAAIVEPTPSGDAA